MNCRRSEPHLRRIKQQGLETVRAGWPGHADADVLTPKMQSVLEARLQQLSPGARDLLGVAAVAGWPVPVDVLSRVGGEPGTARDLDELWRRQLLVTAAADTYDFGHDKLREVALLGLSPAALRRNHRLLAHALEQACAADLDAVAGRIAAHLGAGGRPGQRPAGTSGRPWQPGTCTPMPRPSPCWIAPSA